MTNRHRVQPFARWRVRSRRAAYTCNRGRPPASQAFVGCAPVNRAVRQVAYRRPAHHLAAANVVTGSRPSCGACSTTPQRAASLLDHQANRRTPSSATVVAAAWHFRGIGGLKRPHHGWCVRLTSGDWQRCSFPDKYFAALLL